MALLSTKINFHNEMIPLIITKTFTTRCLLSTKKNFHNKMTPLNTYKGLHNEVALLST